MPWNIFRLPRKWWCWCFLVSPSLSSQGSQLVSSQFNSWTGNWIENFAHLYSASDLNLEIHSLLLSFAGWSGDPALIELATHWAPLLSIDGVLVYPKETVVVCCFVCAVKKEIQEAVMPSRHIGQLAVSLSSQTANARFSSSLLKKKSKYKFSSFLLERRSIQNTSYSYFPHQENILFFPANSSRPKFSFKISTKLQP